MGAEGLDYSVIKRGIPPKTQTQIKIMNTQYLSRYVMGLVLSLFMAGTGLAVDGTWKANVGGGNWSDSTKWVDDPSPVPGGAGSTVTIEATSWGGHFTVTLDGDRTVGTLNLGGPSGRTISGNTLTFDNGESPAEIRAISGSAGTLLFYSTEIVLASSLEINYDVSRTISFQGTVATPTIISGTGGITKNGEGSLLFSANVTGTYTGGFTLNGGSVTPTTSTAFGTGTLTLNNGTVGRAGGSNFLTIGNAFILGGNVTLSTDNASNTTTFSGAGTLTGNRVLTVEGTPSVIFTGGLGDGGNEYGLTKEGAGTLRFATTDATYTGATVVEEGTLELASTSNINASSSLTINGGQVTMGVNNQIGNTAPVTVNAGGTLAMSTFSDTVGTLTLNGGSITGTTGTLTASTYDIRSGSIDKVLAGADRTLAKTTGGTATLSQANTYTGATTISAGTLVISSTGSINGTSGVTINGGDLRYNSATDLNKAVTFTSGTLSGTNWNGTLSGLTIGAGQTINPGNSPGTATTTNQTWAAGGTYAWEINDATGTAGAEWDLLDGAGTLNITATAGNEFTIKVMSLTPENTPGDAANFNDLSDYTWRIADFADVITFDALAFNIDTSAFSNAFTGTFSLLRGDNVLITGGDNTQLWLAYTAIPEPPAWMLLAMGLGALVLRRRRLVG